MRPQDRRRLLHVAEYCRMDVDIAWAAIEHDLPPLRTEIDAFVGNILRAPIGAAARA